MVSIKVRRNCSINKLLLAPTRTKLCRSRVTRAGSCDCRSDNKPFLMGPEFGDGDSGIWFCCHSQLQPPPSSNSPCKKNPQ